MPSATRSQGNFLYDSSFVATITPPASIPTTAVTYASYTIVGLQLLDLVVVQMLSDQTTISIPNAYVSAINTLRLGFSSETGSTVASAAAVQVLVNFNRPENGAAGFSGQPVQAN